jgi:hypothetical protein
MFFRGLTLDFRARQRFDDAEDGRGGIAEDVLLRSRLIDQLEADNRRARRVVHQEQRVRFLEIARQEIEHPADVGQPRSRGIAPPLGQIGERVHGETGHLDVLDDYVVGVERADPHELDNVPPEVRAEQTASLRDVARLDDDPFAAAGAFEELLGGLDDLGRDVGLAQLRLELDEWKLQRLSLVDAALVRNHARRIEDLARERRREFLHQRIGPVRIARFVHVQLRVRRARAMRVRRISPRRAVQPPAAG